jgi:hypothetical protein
MFAKSTHTLILIILSWIVIPGRAMAQVTSYGKLQAAYIYNFAKYTKWPQDPVQFNIGILGETEIMEDIKSTLKDKKASGKGINLLLINTVEQAKDLNILYIPAQRSGNLPLVLKLLEGSSVLVVTEEDLIRKGAAISFVIEDDKLGFKVNKSVLSKTNLVLSEGLLKLAITN